VSCDLGFKNIGAWNFHDFHKQLTFLNSVHSPCLKEEALGAALAGLDLNF
jgi:hypothetical protein